VGSNPTIILSWGGVAEWLKAIWGEILISYVDPFIRMIHINSLHGLKWQWVAMYGLSSSSLEGASYGGPLLAYHTAQLIHCLN
jgi:hypothetical protein